MIYDNHKLNKFIGSYIILNISLFYTNVKFFENTKNQKKYRDIFFI